MIRLAEDINDLRTQCADSPFGCQILSAANAYGLDKPFALFWVGMPNGSDQENANCEDVHSSGEQSLFATSRTFAVRRTDAAYSRLDGVMRICGTITDAEEANAFLHAVGAESVVCSAENAEALGLHVTVRGVILCKDLPAPSAPVEHGEVSLKEVYSVLHACDMVGEFEPFYLDLSHRTRHGTAAVCQIAPAAASVAVFGEDASLITAVGVLPEYRRQGLGSRVVQKMEQRLSGRVYLLRAENENERFYASLGYRPCGAWCAGELG